MHVSLVVVYATSREPVEPNATREYGSIVESILPSPSQLQTIGLKVPVCVERLDVKFDLPSFKNGPPS